MRKAVRFKWLQIQIPHLKLNSKAKNVLSVSIIIVTAEDIEMRVVIRSNWNLDNQAKFE